MQGAAHQLCFGHMQVIEARYGAQHGPLDGAGDVRDDAMPRRWRVTLHGQLPAWSEQQPSFAVSGHSPGHVHKRGLPACTHGVEVARQPPLTGACRYGVIREATGFEAAFLGR